MTSTNAVNKLMKLLKKKGTKILLPQNLSEELLKKMLLEANAMDQDNNEQIPASTILIAILYLVDPSLERKDKIEIKIQPEKLQEYFQTYIASIRFEDMHRRGIITIQEHTLPNVSNIFDTKRIMDILQ